MRIFLKRTGKFSLAYALTIFIYFLFDLVYMPWLTLKFGYLVFLPLYPSILVANYLSLYVYDYFKEDVFFLEMGKNWIEERGGWSERIKIILRKSRNLIFIALSVWPGPIGGYLFLRKSEKENVVDVIKNMAIGSAFCTLFWGGGLSILYYLYKHGLNIYQRLLY